MLIKNLTKKEQEEIFKNAFEVNYPYQLEHLPVEPKSLIKESIKKPEEKKKN